jgi:hypothetical protein
MTQPSPVPADVELYADEAAAVAALRPPASEGPEPRMPLPEWATPPEVVDGEGVTLLRPDDALIRDDRVRPGLRYRDLVRHYGRDRLVLNMEDLRPFGHPFHDDIFALLYELGSVGGRLAICGAADQYVELLRTYHKFIRVVSGARTG